MKQNHLIIFLTLVLSILAQNPYEKMLKNQQGGKQEDVKAVSFQELKKYLPQKNVGDYVLGKSKGSSNNTSSDGSQLPANMSFNMSVSTAEVKLIKTFKVKNPDGDDYDDTKEVEIKITDIAGSGMVGMGLMMAFNTEFEEEKDNDEGYRKTSTRNGYKLIEEFTQLDNDGDGKKEYTDFKISIKIGSRFLVDLSGIPDEATLNSFMDSVDLKGLETLLESTKTKK